ncbi:MULTISPECIES: transposase [Streptomyces]|uniref:Transposase n=1 Tax=Streptomyces edwardsiae TaxID=3075527 RepID=A0ABU2PPY1_9ACTN|nr:transposase [Streptomyces sp. DSM 41636]MDT0393739.1 transposase [Streptomyces sp. DSM 41636]
MFGRLDGIWFCVRTGIPWRDVPVECGPWGRGYDVFRRWQQDGPGTASSPRLQALSDARGAIT